MLLTGDGPEVDILRGLTRKVNIKNIRILKKIERLVDIALPLVGDLEDEIRDQILNSIVIFSWSHYCSHNDTNIPPIDFITSSGSSFYGIGDRNEKDEQRMAWKATLQEYGYSLTDKLDLVLAKSVKTGYVIKNELVSEANARNAEVLASKSEGSFEEAWGLYHDGLENSADDVISGLYESFKNNTKHISVTNLNGTISLFRDLGESEKASEIIDLYVEKRKDEIEIFNIKENNVFGDTYDSEMVQKLNELYENSFIEENAEKILDRISENYSWSKRDEKTLSKISVNEYSELFKKKRGMEIEAVY